MKIIQNPENGQIAIHLNHDEVYNVEDHLDALMNFTIEQSVIIFHQKNSFNKILQRLERLEKEITRED